MIAPNKMLISLFCLGTTLYMLADVEIAASQIPASGVVLIAHGSNHPQLNCNAQVNNLYLQLHQDKSLPPLQVAFLRFEDPVNGKTLLKAVQALHIPGGDNNILFIHLAPSSFSIRHRELEQFHAPSAPGFTPNPPGHVEKRWLYKKALFPHPLPGGIKYAVAPAMDDNSLIVGILNEHALETFNKLNSNLPVGTPPIPPENVSLILVSYGAIEELENILWDGVMEGIGETIRKERGFSEVACVSLRNHSADLIKEQAIRHLIKTAKHLKEHGEVIVVPYVICDGAFHQNLQSYLSGIVSPLNICSRGILSHSNTVETWIRGVIAKGMNQPPGREVNRNWSLMDIEQNDPKGTHKYGFCE